MGLQLAIYEGNEIARRVAVMDQLMIGRGQECTLHFADGSVSTRHARIVREGPRFFIEDLGSHNKTLIEGGATLGKGQRAELRAGMVLLLGRVRLGVEGEAAPTSIELALTAQGGAELDVTLQPALAPASASKPMPEPEEEDPESEATIVPGAAPKEPPRPPQPEPHSPGHAPGHQTDSHTLVPEAPNEALAAHAFFEAMKPLLVIDSDACRKAVRLGGARFTIARSTGELQINHPMLSNPHAQIFYQAKAQRLFVEDKQSKNGTAVNGEALIANRPRELAPQSHLRFGTIDALFWMENSYDGESLDARRKLAFELLLESKKLDRERRKRGEEEAKKQGLPLEAALILTSALSVPSWVQALEQARIRLLVPDHTRSLKLVIAVLVAVILGLGALFALKSLEP